jgi:hypothetical protein
MVEHYRKQNRVWVWLNRIFWIRDNRGVLDVVAIVILALFTWGAVGWSSYVDLANKQGVAEVEAEIRQVYPGYDYFLLWI